MTSRLVAATFLKWPTQTLAMLELIHWPLFMQYLVGELHGMYKVIRVFILNEYCIQCLFELSVVATSFTIHVLIYNNSDRYMNSSYMTFCITIIL